MVTPAAAAAVCARNLRRDWKPILHESSLTTAVNPDTLNEVGVCGAVNLIRFKRGLFSGAWENGREDEWVAEAERNEEGNDIYGASTVGATNKKHGEKEPT